MVFPAPPQLRFLTFTNSLPSPSSSTVMNLGCRALAVVFLNPSESFPYRRRKRAIGANLHLVSESDVRHEHGEKLDRCDELVIASQSRVKLAALVVDHAVIAVRQSPERNGGPLDVLEESLERLSVACRYPARRVEIETRVLPALKELHTLGGDGLAFEHHLERALTEECLERGEVEIMGSGVERALGVEDAKRRDRVEVCVWIEEIAICSGKRVKAETKNCLL